MLLSITSHYFCAGFDMASGRIAPIIKYMKYWDLNKIEEYCRKKGWELIIHE